MLYTNRSEVKETKAAANRFTETTCKPAFQFADARIGIAAQRRLQNLATVFSKEKNPIQRVLHHFTGAPFTKTEAENWNTLVNASTGAAGADVFIASVEEDVYDPTSGVTVANSMAALRGLIRAHILTRIIDRNDADSLNWGDFAPMLQTMAASYGTLTGPVNTGGHSADTYTYSTSGGSQGIAEEKNTHGKTKGNLATRRGQMKVAIDLYNIAVNADADRYL